MKNNINNSHDIEQRLWLWFAGKQKEEYFEVISLMIENKLREVLPQMIEEHLREKIDNLSFDIQTTINGKSSADMKEIITEAIMKELWK